MERFERKVAPVDVVMLVLAVVSVGLLVYEDVYRPSDEVRRWIIWTDLGIVAVFAVEFLVRLAQAHDNKAFVKGHWYDLVGMVPVSHPFFRGFRLVRIVRVVVIVGRVLRASDRTFGEAIVHRQVEKYKGILVEELSRPVVLAAIDATETALVKGNYGTAVARALEARRADIAAHIVDQMRKDGALGLVLKTPGVGAALEQLPYRALAGVAETLGTPQMDDTIRHVIREVLQDLRREVARRDWARARAQAAA